MGHKEGSGSPDSLKAVLLDNYVGPDHRVNIIGLVTGIIGGFLTAVLAGIARIPIAFSEGIAVFLQPSVAAMKDGGAAIQSAVRSVGALWDPVNLGVASLPVNIGLLLASFGLLVVGWKRYVE